MPARKRTDAWWVLPAPSVTLAMFLKFRSALRVLRSNISISHLIGLSRDALVTAGPIDSSPDRDGRVIAPKKMVASSPLSTCGTGPNPASSIKSSIATKIAASGGWAETDTSCRKQLSVDSRVLGLDLTGS